MDIASLIETTFESTQFTKLDTGETKAFIKDGRLFVPPKLLHQLSYESLKNLSFFLRKSHLSLMIDQYKKDESSENDKLVIGTLLQNAIVSAKGDLALCQDTGTAVIYGWKSESIFTGVDDEKILSSGIKDVYQDCFLRASQTAPSSFFDEYNTEDNLPGQISLFAVKDSKRGPSYRFLFAAKGAGSSNKTSYFPMTKALLEESRFETFLKEQIQALGCAACPPYRIAIVIGGASPEINLEILKLATTEILDTAPAFAEKEHADEARNKGWIRRDTYWEKRVMEIGKACGLGAQFGGTSLLLDAKVLRMPRHAASCPVSIGVSCSAHRNILAEINQDGIFIETLEKNPAELLKAKGLDSLILQSEKKQDNIDVLIPRVNLNQSMKEIQSALSQFSAGDKMYLSGKILVARDAAHLEWHNLITCGKDLPEYLYHHPIFYAGPAATPLGKIMGSMGPTTAQRMDVYAGELMSRGIALVTLAKGNRSAAWAAACKTYQGFYLGTIGGAAALFAEKNIVHDEVIDYPELGMEAVRLIEIKDVPAFVITDNKGNDLYEIIKNNV
ncbi:MAG: FumA C-terminus/TtdB family hydratase beta subunit [Treponema sp.]|jgi:fumarate hydratase class I|nr:FumA C-terminus/TtdB family hydratase beta subunit [Treponema sp.]